MKRSIAFVLLTVLSMIFSSALFARSFDFRLNLSPSMPLGLYREVSLPVTRGTLVAACLPEQIASLGRSRRYLRRGRCAAKAEPVLKQVRGIPGDVVTVAPEGVFINGELLAHTAPLAADSHGRPLQAYTGKFRVAPGELWIFSEHAPNGWDSRYFGPIPEQSVISVVQPLLVP
ncbi:MAG TPA: conjugative transfer signal peptidase TraF [Oligoflexia bacterium]|nr:conjugative transfer signal peptidase TraF [Oligoflexia bacterium]